MMLKFMKQLFFGNYFYGICAVALSIEASLQQQVPINSFLYYFILFVGTIFYYTNAYTHINDTQSHNPRIYWYSQRLNKIKTNQTFRILTIFILSIFYLKIFVTKSYNYYIDNNLLLLIIFPISGLLYYGISSKGVAKYNFRSVGWLKPILIGFTWAGIVTLYPVIFSSIEQQHVFEISTINNLLFLKNMMFITVLCIMFDVKDYASDYNKSLKTFVVYFGLRNTIFYILIPLSTIGLGTFIMYGINHDFSIQKLIINSIPFALLLRVAYTLKSRKSIFYYLIVIDGLMLIKALCGSIAELYF
jgi:hypothetical protein